MKDRREYQREYYKANRDKVKDRHKKYYQENRDKSKEYAKANADKIYEYQKEYRKKNADKIREHNKDYHKANVDKIKERKKEYRKVNADKIRLHYREYVRNRRNVDPIYKMRRNLNRALNLQLKRQSVSKNNRTFDLVGMSGKELMDYLMSINTDPNITPDNYGSYWHIDHIRPVSSFDLSDPEQLKECWHYTNLQPLEASENLKKSNKILSPV